jgi:zinc protease
VVFDDRRKKAYALLFSGAVLLSALSVARAGDTAAATAPAQAVPPSQPWPQSVSDLPVDPAVRFGTLANGVRYAILRNVTPPGQASLWMRIDAGSLMEKDDQLGLAHFMEHMAFGGTKHFPKKELVQTLQRMGAAFGADLNAFTDFDQTVYQLNVPNADAQTLGTGLLMLRDQGGEALMEPGEIDDERGVIAGEERLRNVPSLSSTGHPR